MAGGPFAAVVPCMVCMDEHRRITKATRTHEGVESDQYRCDGGHAFGIDWRTGPATEPQWPPDPDGSVSGGS